MLDRSYLGRFYVRLTLTYPYLLPLLAEIRLGDMLFSVRLRVTFCALV